MKSKFPPMGSADRPHTIFEVNRFREFVKRLADGKIGFLGIVQPLPPPPEVMLKAEEAIRDWYMVGPACP